MKAVALTLLTLAWGGSALAENPQHLRRLATTNQCSQCDLRGVGLVFAQMERLNVAGANLQDANLGRGKFAGGVFRQANLQRVSFFGSDLTGADFTNADLRGADLADANLAGANLTGANLTGANLNRAYLEGAIVHNAVFEGAYLRDAAGLPPQVVQAKDYYAWGLEEAQRGRHDRAIAYLDATLQLDETLTDARMARAVTRSRIGDMAGAIEDAKQAEAEFTKAGASEKAKVAKEFHQGLAQTNKPPGFWDNFLNSVAPMLFQFFLR
ncbi:MAG: pentapeptide repeat-containing protein [Oscillatoriales cyanobacterium SM2_1_8]|nr:pentapeptide repeat-containing protein [Oscillatoriales cyanobacterium SM2_1_8]